MLVYIQPIFAPNEDLLNKNVKSIQSLVEYLTLYPYKLKVITGGWCISEEYWKEIENALTKFDASIEIILKKFDQNYGKAHVVNTLFNQFVSILPIDYFLTADSDMIFDIGCSNMFQKLLAVAPVIEDTFEKKLGMLSLQQRHACCHVVTENWTRQNILNMTILQPETSMGLAGGAMFVNKKAWIEVGGYRVLNVYGGNDGWYLNDVAAKDFFFGLIEDIFMIHPFENSEKYVNWKREQIEKNLNGGIKLDFEELKNRAINSVKDLNE